MTNPSTEQMLQAALDSQRAGRFPEAEGIFRQVLAREPRNAHALNGLGTLALHLNRPQDAASLFNEAIAANPSELGFHMNLGTALLKMSRLMDAGQVFQRIVQMKPDYAEAYANLGVVLSDLGRLEDAVNVYRRAIQLKPQFATPYQNLGAVLRDMGRHEEAVQVLRQGLAVDPTRVEMMSRLGLVYLSLGLTDRSKYDEAITVLRQALTLQPNHPYVLTNLGVALARLGRPEESIAYHRQALEIYPSFAGALINLGVALRNLGRFDEAKECYLRALALEPNDPNLHQNLAFELLVQGDWEQGFREYERRLEDKSLYRRDWPKPRWDGSDLSGRTILLAAEQGIGDTINFIRYAPLLAERGAKVLVEAQDTVVSLIGRVPGVSSVSAQGQTLPEHDFYAPVPSLPFAFQTRPDTIPANVPYLSAQPERAAAWKDRLAQYGAAFKVGLVWGGSLRNRNDIHRSMLLADFAPLADVKGARFFSLQTGPQASQIFSAPPGTEIVDLGPSLTSFEETAAALANLDLLISVDTAIVHLAGAMGRPVWNLIAFAPDWRWMLNRPDTTWYPTMKLFRQPAYKDWAGAVRQVKEQLEDRVKTRMT